MIKLKIEAENGKDLREQLEALLGVYGGTKEIQVEVSPKEEATPQEEEKATPPVEEKKKRAPKKTEVVEEKVEETPEEEVATTSGEAVSKDLLIQSMLEKNRGGKKNEVKALLGEFGVNRITELKEAQYQDFYDKMSAL